MLAAAVMLALSATGWDALFAVEGDGRVNMSWDGGGASVRSSGGTFFLRGAPQITTGVPGRLIISRRSEALYLRANSEDSFDLLVRVRGEVSLETDGKVRLLSKRRAVPVLFSDDFTRTRGEASVWESLAGEMRVLSEPHPERAVSAFKLEKPPGGTALMATGHRAWSDYLFSAAVRVAPGARAGLACSVAGEDCVLFRAGESGCELVRVEAGRENTLARADARLKPAVWHLLALACTPLGTVGYLDGKAVLRDEGASSGKVGLWADGPGGVFFDDAGVEALWGRTPGGVLRGLLFGRKGRASSRASRDSGMLEWAGRAWAWEGKLSRMTHYESSRVRVCFPEPPRSGEAELGLFSARGLPQYLLRAAFAEGGTELELTGGKELLWKGKKDPPESLALRAEGRMVTVEVEGKEVVSLGTVGPRRGKAFFSSSAGGGRVELSSLNELDLYFDRSPVEWLPVLGEWGVRSLWGCDPRWRWYSGTSGSGGRVAWNWLKFPVSGDFELKAVVGVRMLGDQTPYYQYPANVCFAFAPFGPGREEGEPLVFVAGTADLPWRIFRGRRVLAEWSEMHHPEARASFGNMNKLFHTSWYEIRLGRTGRRAWMKARYLPIKENRKFKKLEGDRIECAAPKGKGLIGVGVVDNGFVMPRLTLSAEKWHDARNEFPPPPDLVPVVHGDAPEFAGVLERVMAAPSRPSRAPAPLRLHRAFERTYGKRLVYEEFEDASWEGNVGGHDGCRLFLDGDAYSGQKSLLVASANIGGRFELPLARGAFPTRSYPRLRFAVRVPRRTALGLRIVADGRLREYSLTDPKFTPALGSVRADDRWHLVEVDLEKLLGDRIVTYIALEDPGWQESVRGDYYRLDGFALVPRIPRGGPRTGLGVRFVPDERKGELVADGARIPVVFADEPGAAEVRPRIAGLGARDLPRSMEVELGEGGKDALDLATAAISVAGRDYAFTDGSFAVREAKLVWKGPLDGVPADGEEIEVAFRARTFSGERVQARAAFVCDYSLDKKPPPPPAPVCRHERELFFAGFEDGCDWAEVSNRGGMTVSAAPGRGPDSSTACVAEHAPFNQWENYVFLRRAAFDASEYSRLSMYFKGRQGLELWLGARLSGEVYGIFDAHFRKGGELTREARLPCDSKWHYVDMGLKGLLSRYPGFPRVEQLFVSGRRGRRRRSRAYYLDSVRVYSPRGTRLRFEWLAPRDLTGISGYSFVLDRSPDTVPPEELKTDRTEASFERLEPGAYHFHIRARDGAGNWSETAHLPAYLEAPRR